MNENILNDLLECSVCLERLDASSKVLPCQHTFCRQCLEKIQSAHQEFRCPECRILVETKIEDLPSNILLLRILEGMKNISSIKQDPLPQVKLHQETKLQQNEMPSNAIAANSIAKSNQLQQYAINSDFNKRNSKQFLEQQRKWALTPHAYAIYDYKSTETMCLQFQKGDLILLMHQIDQNWYVGYCLGNEGAFPINHVQIIVPLPLPQCIALYDFKMGPNDEEGCLTFSKGTRIQVIRRVDMNWAEGRIDTDIGIFPLAFVQLNAMAKQLLYNKYQYRLHVIIVPSTPSTVNSNNNKSGRINSQLTYNQQTLNTVSTQRSALPSNDVVNNNRNDTVTCTEQFSHNNQERITSTTDDAASSNLGCVSKPNVIYRQRRSLNSNAFQGSTNLTESKQLQNQTNKRHSAEILSLPDAVNNNLASHNLHMIGNNSTSALRYSQNKQQYSKSQENLQSSSSNTNKKFLLQNIQKKDYKLEQSSNCTNLASPPLPWSYIACHSYTPRNSNELELKKGYIYVVTDRYSNGWFKGNNTQEVKGLFPGEYVAPLKWNNEQQLILNARMINDPQKEGNSPPVSKDMTNRKDILDKEKHITIGCLATSSVSSTPSSSTASATHKGIGLKNLFNHFKKRSKSPNLNDEVSGSGIGPTGSSQLNENANAQNNTLTPIGIDADKISDATAMHPSTSADNANCYASHLQQTPSALHIRSGSCPSQLLRNESNHEEEYTTSAPKDLNKSSSVVRHESYEKHPPLYANTMCSDTALTTIYGNQLKQQQQKIANRDRITAKQHTSDSNYHQLYRQLQQQQQQLKSSKNIVNLDGSFHKPTDTIINHQKSHSLDASNKLRNLHKYVEISEFQNRKESCASNINKPNNNNSTKGHFGCITAPLPNIEVGHHMGDVIHINCETKSEWYKGTNSRTQKTRTFPITFVELASSNRK